MSRSTYHLGPYTPHSALLVLDVSISRHLGIHSYLHLQYSNFFLSVYSKSIQFRGSRSTSFKTFLIASPLWDYCLLQRHSSPHWPTKPAFFYYSVLVVQKRISLLLPVPIWEAYHLSFSFYLCQLPKLGALSSVRVIPRVWIYFSIYGIVLTLNVLYFIPYKPACFLKQAFNIIYSVPSGRLGTDVQYVFMEVNWRNVLFSHLVATWLRQGASTFPASVFSGKGEDISENGWGV